MLISISAYVFIAPKEQISESEKRALATWPEFSLQGYINGNYFASISSYINDHFPLRLKMIELANQIRYNLGIHPQSQERIILVHPSTENEPALVNDTTAKAYNDDFKA
ncbi:MAG: DHHW family protein, partial [Flavobacteriales bacterium]